MFMGGCNNCGLVMDLTWPRLRRIYANREYAGPNDLISDRYNSVTLRFLTSFSQIFMLLTFVAIEWNVVAVVVPGITQGDFESGNSAVWFLATFVLACEFVGGMTSVAITDSIQMCATLPIISDPDPFRRV